MDLTYYPKGYEENLAWRREILLKAKKDLGFRARVKELFHRDALFAFNCFFFTLDVRKRPWQHQPFATYPYQDETILTLVECIEGKEDVVIEKSRDMGYTWMVIGVLTWYWLSPSGGADFLLGSRIEDYVDKKGDMRTLMEKVRYLLHRLPRWLWPKDFKAKVHDNFMRLQNPETGAAITGESNNPNFSTGGRYLAVFFDEFAKWEGSDKSAWTAAGDATPCRLAGSTPFGAAGHYYDLVTDGKTKKVRLHWSRHPEKASGAYCQWPRRKEQEDWDEERLVRSPWYDRECARRRPLEIAQELDIDYVGAGNPVFDGKAGKRVGFLLGRGRDALRWYEPLLGGRGECRAVGKPRDGEGYLAVYEDIDSSDSFVLGVDVVEGREDGDFAVVKVVNRRTKGVAGSYFSKIDEVQLATVIAGISKLFTTFEAPWVGIETIGPGLSTFDLCAENFAEEVPNLFMMPSFDQVSNSVSLKKGWRTGGASTSSSKNVLISGVREWLIEGEAWADQRLVRELTTFVRSKTGKAEAKAGANDDEVMAFGIALQVDLLSPKGEERVEKRKMATGVSEDTFDLEKLRVEEPLGLEERCLVSALAAKAAKARMQNDLIEDMVDFTWAN